MQSKSKKNGLITRLLLLICFSLIFCSQSLFSQKVTSQSISVPILFPVNKSVLDESNTNSESIKLLKAILTDHTIVNGLDSLVINGTSSPDGTSQYNYNLAKRRSQSIYNYILTLNRQLLSKKNKIKINVIGEDWNYLSKLLSQDKSIKSNSVQSIISNELDLDKREHLINSSTLGLKSYLESNYYPYLRISYISLYSQGCKTTELILIKLLENDTKIRDKSLILNIIKQDKSHKEKEIELMHLNTSSWEVVKKKYHIENLYNNCCYIRDPEPKKSSINASQGSKRLGLVLKSNLLYDLGTIINISLEVPIGNQWSVSMEYMTPWWTIDNGKIDSRRLCIQLQSLSLEGRYWFKEANIKSDRLQGFFAGAYFGVGHYDFENRSKGYQSDFFTSGGLSGGYVQRLNNSFSLEYSLSLGYIYGKYAKYQSIYDNDHWISKYIDQSNLVWIGPTRLGVSLVWAL